MPPLTVLHVIPTLETGGAESMLASLVAAKRAQPMSQAVTVFAPSGKLGDKIRAAGVPIFDLNCTYSAAMPLAVVRLARLIKRLQPRAIQSWLYYADLLSLWGLEVSGRRPVTRLYWGVRCSDMEPARYRFALRWAIAAATRRAGRPDAVVANSFVGREVHRRLGYAPRAFPVIPNGIDVSRFRPDTAARIENRARWGVPDDRPVVIHVARVDPMKDHDSLMAVAQALPEVAFIAVGTGTQSLQAPANLIALGERNDVEALYGTADFALSTSAFGEGFSNVIAEAMASGVPVVATDVGDARKIVGETGAIAPPRDVPALTSAIRKLLSESPQQRAERGAASRQRIERLFSLNRAVATFDALHREGIVPSE
jgi:glycosyltransferase involved in cell wall biosynthesis